MRQTELTKNHEKYEKLHVAVQASGYRECLSLSVDCSSAGSRIRCDQVDKLFSLVEIRDEVQSMRSTRESEREINWWDHLRPP